MVKLIWEGKYDKDGARAAAGDIASVSARYSANFTVRDVGCLRFRPYQQQENYFAILDTVNNSKSASCPDPGGGVGQTRLEDDHTAHIPQPSVLRSCAVPQIYQQG